MKEYKVIQTRDTDLLTGELNNLTKRGWVPTHFAVSASNDVDTFAVLLERGEEPAIVQKAHIPTGLPKGLPESQGVRDS